MRRAGVVGSPIRHSLSPAMHRAAYAALGLDWRYDAVDVAAGELAEFVAGLDESWQGLSVTMPGKVEAAALGVRHDEVTGTLGVANTLIRDGDTWVAANTDVPGALNALHAVGVRTAQTVRIIGAGATATSMLLVASKLGASRIELVVRDRERALATLALAGRLGLDADASLLSEPVGEPMDVVVNTAPGLPFAGRTHEFVGATRVCVFDVLYDPWPSPLLESAQSEGVAVVSGLDLLAHQAALQVHLMTGELVDPDLLHAAALAAR